VWEVKGIAALGAFEAEERLEAMDRMGVSLQLAFPNTLMKESRLDGPGPLAAVRRYNDHALAWTKATGERTRVVCQLNLRHLEPALEEARRVVDAGAKGVILPCAYPPGGVSPANPQWDPLWDLLSETDTPVFLHIGSGGMLDSDPGDPIMFPRAIADAPSLRSVFPDRPGSEERIGPFWVVVAHQAAELFLTAMVMGAVFERFPTLRFGAIEFGAQWTGPWTERMDHHAELLAKVGAALPLKPSEYVSRNLRVTPFWAEPVEKYVDRYGLADVYVFSTDYPHVEGGKDPIGRFLATASQVSADYIEPFFVGNARLLFP
jgi:predicted TIM-barrel fold metal-dependent hydrolase